MKTQTLFFSPTQTGATVATTIQRALALKIGEAVDLTTRSAESERDFGADDLIIVAMPVYGGRLPALAVERFRAMRGNGARAVAVAIYGNAKVDDALLELSDLCTEQGFEVIAAASFIGEHSFASKQFPIAAGRPDAQDLQKAAQFGQLIRERLDLDAELTLPPLPGQRPYKERGGAPGSAAAESNPEHCIQCGLCETFCPAGAIAMTETGPQTDPNRCIWCAACVRVCTSHARTISNPKLQATAERLHTHFQERKEPEWFLAQA